MLLVGFHNHVPNAARVAVDCDVRRRSARAPRRRSATCSARPAGSAWSGARTGAVALGCCASRSSWTRRTRSGARVKSAEELDHLRYAAWLTDRSAAALVEAAVPGATELDLIDAVESSYGGTGATNHIHYVATTSMAAPDRCVPGQWPTSRVGRGRVGGGLRAEHGVGAGHPGPAAAHGDGRGRADAALRASCTRSRPRCTTRSCRRLRPGVRPADLLACADPVLDKGFVTVDDLVHGFGGGYLAPVLSHRGRADRRATPSRWRRA